MSQDRSPLGSSRPTPILDLDIQRHLTHFRYHHMCFSCIITPYFRSDDEHRRFLQSLAALCFGSDSLAIFPKMQLHSLLFGTCDREGGDRTVAGKQKCHITLCRKKKRSFLKTSKGESGASERHAMKNKM